jgi:hypothetical protein
MRVQWTIVVTAETGDEVEGAMRLKGLLKVALRRFGMRCTTISETRLVPAPLLRESRRREECVRERRGRGRGGEAGLFD